MPKADDYDKARGARFIDISRLASNLIQTQLDNIAYFKRKAWNYQAKLGFPNG